LREALTGELTSMHWPDIAATPEYSCGFGCKVCYSATPEEFNCSGHRVDDELPLRRLLGSSVAGDDDGAWYTNRRVRDLIDPLHDHGLPYVFDDFDYDHCLALGYDFAALLNTDTSSATSVEPAAWRYQPEW
jgi:hypothetical protein